LNIVHFEDEPWDSGIAHYAVTLAREQSAKGHRVAFWGRDGSPVLCAAAASGLKTQGWPAGPLAWLELSAMKKELDSFGAQVINAHTGSSHLLALAAATARTAVVRTRGDARAPRGGLLARLAASRTAAFIAANSSLKMGLESAFPGARVSLVCQGVEGPAETTPLPASPVVGVLARLDPVKGHEILFDASLLLKAGRPGLRVLCAGDGELRESLSRKSRQPDLQGTAELLGHVQDKWRFLASCRIGVVPSIGSEAVSRAALEWMAAGRSLVASRVGGLPDLVADGVTGILVPPNDPSSLFAALDGLLNDPSRAEEMGRNARQRWERLFSPEPFYRETQNVYAQAIKSLPR